MHDLVIAGGGPVGLAAALAAHARGLDTVVLEARSQSASRDPRVFALSYGARLILERLDVWSDIERAHPIRVVHVSERGRLGQTFLHADDLDIDALGYVVAHADLLAALHRHIAARALRCIAGARLAAIEDGADFVTARYEQAGQEERIVGRIVALADGGAQAGTDRAPRTRRYGQRAIVTEVRATRARADYAYERFTPQGPIALLPGGDRHALIWTVPESSAADLVACDDATFARALMTAYGERIGDVEVVAPRAAFDLALRFARQITAARSVLIGNAAQTLHPVAGQGFNLGLRDAVELADTLAAAHARREDLLSGLARYRSRRRVDRTAGTLFTDFLVRAFSNDVVPLGFVRSAGLALLDVCDPAKRFLMRRMIFGAAT